MGTNRHSQPPVRTVSFVSNPGAGLSLILVVRAAVESFKRPYPVSPAMGALVSLVPLYVFIPSLFLPGRTLHSPALPLDDLVPLQPLWVFVYGALYLFLIVLPVLTIRDEGHVQRTVRAYLLVWLTAYVVFVAFPTAAPRPPKLAGDGFGMWGVWLLYSADPPFNCFPSLHVAHSFVSALTCYRLYRPLGRTCIVAASLVALSTLFTKQHYSLDVIAGIVLAFIAYALFLHPYTPQGVTTLDRHVAVALAVGLFAVLGCGVASLWALHQWGVV